VVLELIWFVSVPSGLHRFTVLAFSLAIEVHSFDLIRSLQDRRQSIRLRAIRMEWSGIRFFAAVANVESFGIDESFWEVFGWG